MQTVRRVTPYIILHEIILSSNIKYVYYLIGDLLSVQCNKHYGDAQMFKEVVYKGSAW